MKGLFDYCEGDSFIHRLNPLTKILLSISICAASFISNSHFLIICLIGLSLAIAAISGIFNRAVIMLKGLLKLSIILFVFQLIFENSGNVLLELPLNIKITTGGISFAFLIVLRLISATMPLALMISVTKMNDLANVLVEKLFIPYKYAYAVITAIRFIPVFSEEMTGIMEAQTARGVEFDTKNFFKKMKLILPLCVPLLISSVKKSENSAISVELRGFNLRNKKSCYKTYKMNFSDWLTLLFSCFLIAGAIFLNAII